MVLTNLCNCIGDLYELEKSDKLLDEGIDSINKTLVELGNKEESAAFTSYLCNSLEVLLIKKINSKDRQHRGNLVEEAISVLKESMSNSEKEMLLYAWASAKLNLANLLVERSYLFESGSAEATFNRIIAISEFQAVLDSFTVLNFPMEFAQAHANLGQALVEHAAAGLEGELTELYLERAMASYEIAMNAFTEDKYPQRWASITLQMARTFAIHAQLEGIESAKDDLEHSRALFEKALNFYRNNGPPEMVEYCLEPLSKIEEQLRNKYSQ